MKIALNILLVLASIGMVYLLIESIRKPINFKETKEFREQHVRERLQQTAKLQKIHKSLRKTYAVSFDSLKFALTHDTFLVDQVTGDNYDTNQVATRSQIKLPAKDSLQAFIKKSKQPNMTIDEYFDYLSTVPFSKGKKFTMRTGEAIVEGTDSMMAPTFEVATRYEIFMQEFDSAAHVIYDPDYNPQRLQKVGDLYKPSTNGNW